MSEMSSHTLIDDIYSSSLPTSKGGCSFFFRYRKINYCISES